MGLVDKIRGAQCVLCTRRVRDTSIRVVIHARSDPDTRSLILGADERGWIGWLNKLGVPIDTLHALRQDIRVCDACRREKVGPVVKALIAERVELIRTRLRPPHNGNGVGPHDEELGGIGAAGFPEALFGFFDLCALHKSLAHKVAFSYWICRLTTELLASGALSSSDVSPDRSAILAECLAAEFKPNQDYMWPSWLETIITIEKHGIGVARSLQSQIATIEAKDRSSHTLGLLKQLR